MPSSAATIIGRNIVRHLCLQTAEVADSKAQIWGDTIAEVAAKHEPGLQLLMLDVCDNAKNVALPQTLRYLLMSNRYNNCHGNLCQMLKSLHNLEELYLMGFPARRFYVGQPVGQLLQTFQKLRIAVLDYYHNSHDDAPVELGSTALLPSVELLALPWALPYSAAKTTGTCAHTPVKLMCPNLKELMCSCESDNAILFLEHLLSEGAPELETIQVALNYERRKNYIDLFCKEIGSLVAEGALPSLEVSMYPGSDEAGNALVGPGPLLEAASHVNNFFLPQPDGWQNGDLTWIRPSHLDTELQRRVLAALTIPLYVEDEEDG
ncbi:g5712 [Coccomyxa elongata]